MGACYPDAAGSNAEDDAGAGAGGGGADASAGGADASMGDEDSGAAPTECNEDLDAVLGADCTSDDDCNCAAPFCALMPGQPMGICTVYCDPEADDCPDGYRCFDLSALGVEGYEPFCTEE